MSPAEIRCLGKRRARKRRACAYLTGDARSQSRSSPVEVTLLPISPRRVRTARLTIGPWRGCASRFSGRHLFSWNFWSRPVFPVSVVPLVPRTISPNSFSRRWSTPSRRRPRCDPDGRCIFAASKGAFAMAAPGSGRLQRWSLLAFPAFSSGANLRAFSAPPHRIRAATVRSP